MEYDAQGNKSSQSEISCAYRVGTFAIEKYRFLNAIHWFVLLAFCKSLDDSFLAHTLLFFLSHTSLWTFGFEMVLKLDGVCPIPFRTRIRKECSERGRLWVSTLITN